MMVYRVHAELRFSTTTARTTALNTIGATGTVQLSLRGSPAIAMDRSSATQAGIVTEYNKVTGLTTPLVGSLVGWHACFHGDQTGACGPVTQKLW